MKTGIRSYAGGYRQSRATAEANLNQASIGIYALDADREPCGWCSLRIAKHMVHSTPTCTECKDGGRQARVRESLQRMKRARAGK